MYSPRWLQSISPTVTQLYYDRNTKRGIFGLRMRAVGGIFRNRVELDLLPGTGASDSRQYVDYLESLADANNMAKRRGFYVDISEDGALLVPQEIERPSLADEIRGAADTVKSMLVGLALVGDRDPRLSSIDALIAPILARDLRDG